MSILRTSLKITDDLQVGSEIVFRYDRSPRHATSVRDASSGHHAQGRTDLIPRVGSLSFGVACCADLAPWPYCTMRSRPGAPAMVRGQAACSRRDPETVETPDQVGEFAGDTPHTVPVTLING